MEKLKTSPDLLKENLIENGMDLVEVVYKYEGMEVNATGIKLLENNGDKDIPFLFWKGMHLGKLVSAFWVNKSFEKFTRNQMGYALIYATETDTTLPPEVVSRQFEGGLKDATVAAVYQHHPSKILYTSY